jgi:chromosome segregation ATPase
MSDGFESTRKPFPILPVLLGLLALLAIIGYIRLSSNLGSADEQILTLQKQLETAVGAAGKTTDALTANVQKTDEIYKALSDFMDVQAKRLDQLNGTVSKATTDLGTVSTEVEDSKKDIKTHGGQISTLQKRIKAFDQKFEAIHSELKRQADKHHGDLADILKTVEEARGDLNGLKNDMELVKESVEFVPTEK